MTERGREPVLRVEVLCTRVDGRDETGKDAGERVGTDMSVFLDDRVKHRPSKKFPRIEYPSTTGRSTPVYCGECDSESDGSAGQLQARHEQHSSRAKGSREPNAAVTYVTRRVVGWEDMALKVAAIVGFAN